MELRRLSKQSRLTARQYLVAARDFAHWRQERKLGSSIEARIPWITRPAMLAISESIGEGQAVVEYGVGGSTLWFLDRGCHLMSIEHDPGWAKKVQNEVSSTHALAWELILVPPSPRKSPAEWDPSDYTLGDTSEGPESSFLLYAQAPPFSLEVRLVLVDGRARPTCLVYAEEMFPNAKLVLDQSERSHYRCSILEVSRRRGKPLHLPGSIRGVNHLSRTSIWNARSGEATSS